MSVCMISTPVPHDFYAFEHLNHKRIEPAVIRILFCQILLIFPTQIGTELSRIIFKMRKLTPRPFSGEADICGKAKDLGIWLEHYLVICRLNNWNTDHDMISHVPISFIGEAEVWYSVNADWINAERM